MRAAEFFARTFTDPKGQPDAKLLTAFVLVLFQLAWFAHCQLTSTWPPEGIVLAYTGLEAALFGFGSLEINKSITMDTQANIAHQANPNNINVDVKNPE